MSVYPQLREHRRLAEDQAEGWSPFRRAISPIGGHETYYQERNPGSLGYIVNSVVNNIEEECGIYEWKIERPGNGPGIVVYVGSTCPYQEKRGLKSRILRYCRDGAHKTELINDAIRRGYELHVRVKSAENEHAAGNLENALLKKYNYAWNIRENGKREPEGYN